VNVSGGLGGVTKYQPTQLLPSQGGNGGTGLARVEQMGSLVDFATTAMRVAPYDLALSMMPNYWLTVGWWSAPRNRPETYSAAVSCWMRPSVDAGQNFFSLDFPADDLSANPPVYGWNMDIIYDSPTGEHLLHYRDPSPHSDPNYPAFPNDADFETFLGNMLNYGLTSHQGSYLCVRFQGAVSNGLAQDLCSVKLSGAPNEIQIVPGSLTPWVQHPSELNLFNPRPNMIRYTVVFDRLLAIGASTVGAHIKGVTNLKIQVTPN
jgi:hypothetical protein